MPDIALWILAACFPAVLVGLASLASLRRRARRVLGVPLYATRGRRRWQVAWIVIAAALAIQCTRLELRFAVLCLLLLAGSIVLLIWTPSESAGACGERGLRRGWDALAFADLVEWRLTGDHLRYRCGDEWAAVELPRAHQARVRAELERICPERESPYRL